MSNDAINWAFGQDIPNSSAKFVLVVLANYVRDDSMISFASSACIREATGQDIKTVHANMKRLREWGYITDTGQRKGGTGQVIVYQLKTPESGSVPSRGRAPVGGGASGRSAPEFGPVSPPKAPENGRVETHPKTDVTTTEIGSVSAANTPKNGFKHTRFSLKHTQKRETEPNEPNEPIDKAIAVSAFVLPDWVPPESWKAYVQMRIKIKKPLTEFAMRLALKKLEELGAAGHAPGAVLDQSTLSAWQGLFPLRAEAATARRTSGVHIGHQDYSQGWG